MFHLRAALLVVLILLLVAACGKQQERLLKVTRTSLHTITSMTVVTGNEQQAQQLLMQLTGKWSVWDRCSISMPTTANSQVSTKTPAFVR